MLNIKRKKKGFTLIEMLVAMTLFSFVITISLGALFTILKSNEKAKVIKLVVNNLNVALEGMSREIRMGSKYQDSLGTKNGTNTFLTFLTKEGCEAGYKLDSESLKRKITRRDKTLGDSDTNTDCHGGDSDYIAITGDDIKITKAAFITTGIDPSDNIQPRVLIILRGEVERANLENKEVFNIQTTVSQRKIEQ